LSILGSNDFEEIGNINHLLFEQHAFDERKQEHGKGELQSSCISTNIIVHHSEHEKQHRIPITTDKVS